MWSDIKSTLLQILERHVPSKMSSTRFNQPWINTRVKRLTRRKKRSFIKAKRSGKEKDFKRYQHLKKQCRSECKLAYNNFLADIVSPDSENNPKRFWSFINGKRCDSSGVAPLKSSQGIIHSDSNSKASILNSQFVSVFNKDEDVSNIKNKGTSPHPQMNHIEICPAGVHKLFSCLHIHKATGPDGLSARLLKELAVEITPIFTLLFQASLHQGELPDDWKKANVVPIFKKGEKNQAVNYRPISLTSIPCKIMEHIISSNIMSHLEEANILTDAQHGFRKKRSCESQLILAIQDLAKDLDSRIQNDVILLDFSKAFDKVPHARLLYKLKHYGVCGTTYNWITDFLSNRSQQVVLEGSTSETADVTSGVPQGSVLGPLLFLIFINDLPEYISSSTKVRLFADDCMLYREIKSNADSIQLQEDLNSLAKWEKDWLMDFNPKKCQVLQISKKRNPITFDYNIHGHILESPNTVKYLGMNLTKDLSWNHHINVISKKANSASAFLQRNIGPCPRNTKVLCYKTLIRPIMEYGSTVWDPSTQRNINKLEMVQRRYARFINNDFRRTSSVTPMLHELQWPTLRERRAQFKAVMMFRIVHGLIGIPPSYLATAPRMSQRGHSQKFIVPFARTDVFQHTFFPDAIRLWNSLPEDVVNCTSVDQFRSEVQRIQIR